MRHRLLMAQTDNPDTRHRTALDQGRDVPTRQGKNTVNALGLQLAGKQDTAVRVGHPSDNYRWTAIRTGRDPSGVTRR